MARTPLLRNIARLASRIGNNERAESRAAESRPDASPQGALSRREALQVAGVGVAGAALAACDGPALLSPADVLRDSARRAAKGEPAQRIAIIGAGLAGLTCAYRLRQAGVDATVYEASERLGGRCWTNRTTFPGQLAEHGGELIDQSHKNIRALAQELGLSLDNVLAAEQNGTETFFHIDGEYAERDVERDFKPVWQALKRDYVEAGYPTLYNSSTPRGRELDAMSVANWIDSRVPGGRTSRLGRLLDIAYVIEYGANADQQSALNLVYLLGAVGQGNLRLFGPSNEKYKVRGGNDQIVARMAALLGGRIETGAALRGIARNGESYTLQFDGHAPVIADRVVLALPFSVMRERVDITAAGFSTRKRKAIAELGMGSNAKLALQFSTRAWRAAGCNGDTFSDTGYQATWEVTRAQDGVPGILVNFTGGSVTDAQSGRMPAALATEFLGRIAPVIPGLPVAYNGRVSFDDWPRNPWTLGSYSYFKPGQYTAFAGVEGEVSNACHFAGEHTSIDSQGYLNGAVESGERAAREVMAAVGVTKKA